MRQTEIIKKLKDDIEFKAFRAFCCETLKALDYDKSMMEYHENIYNGEAFEAISLLNWITNSSQGDDIYNDATTKAHEAIVEAGYDIITILDLAGWNGKEHYEIAMRYA